MCCHNCVDAVVVLTGVCIVCDGVSVSLSVKTTAAMTQLCQHIDEMSVCLSAK